MRRYRKSKFNKFLTIIALSLTFFVTIGYARLKETLTITSSAKFSPIPVLKATYEDDENAFRSSTYKEKIKTITFEDKINVPNNAIESWDVSEQQNGAYMAYVLPNETDSTFYDLYIQGNGKIYANQDMSYWFKGLSYVDSINNIDLLDTEITNNMSSMFDHTGYNSPVFTLDISNFDTSKVTDMSNMFNQTGFYSPVFTLDISNFDTKNVTDMNSMFLSTGYSSPTFNLDLSSFDTSKVTDMSKMFWYSGYSNTEFTLDISNFDTSNVTNMYGMFVNTGYNSTIFTLDVSNFNTSKVIDMSYMFWQTGNNSTIFTLDVSSFDTSNVTNMHQMFTGAGFLSPIFTMDVSGFNTGKVTDMSQMFYLTGYSSTKFNTSITIKNPNTTSYASMFNGVATKEGSQIIVNYISETSDLVDAMIATKSYNSNVVKGVQVD